MSFHPLKTKPLQVLDRLTQVATLKGKAKETVQVVTYNRHHYL